MTVLLAALLAIFPGELSAQDNKIQVKGNVADIDGKPIPGATIMVKGNTSYGGAISDDQGNFTFSFPAGETLQVVCMGYVTVESRFSRNSDWMVTMDEDAQMLDDVVVVGYGVQKKESVVGSISQVGAEALVNSGTTNITNAIAGKLAGVLTFQSSGTPGASDAEIFVRGVSSWNGSTPLIMVDGVERSFSELDPNEVETISVLKDASATAVFGAKGANGVILVTTKTGQKGKPKMNLTVNYGLESPQELAAIIDAGTTAEMMNVAYMNDASFGSVMSKEVVEAYRSGSDPIRYPNNNWYNLLLKDFSNSLNVNYNLRGGTDRVKYYVSVGYTNEGSLVKRLSEWKNATFNYQKINYRSNIDFDVTKSTKLSLKIGGSTGISTRPGTNSDGGVSVGSLFTYMYMASPMMFPAYYPASVMEQIPDWNYPGVAEDRLAQQGMSYIQNPYSVMATGDFLQTTTNKLNTDLHLTQNLDFITKGLSLKGMASLTSSFARYSQEGSQSRPSYRIDWEKYDQGVENPWASTESANDVYVQPPYAVTINNYPRSTSIVFYWEASLNYNRTFKKKHNVTGLLLANQRQQISGASFPHRSQAFVFRGTYDYASKYLFEINMGYTGSEQFSSKNRYGFFPSVAAGYVISKEKFWKKAMPWWSKMKVRYSDGTVGSDNASANWLYYSTYSKETNTGLGLIIEDKAANETARWETARKQDLGIEMGFFKDQLSFNVDLFQETRTDMLLTPVESPLLGITSKDVNAGSMKKHGIDIEGKWRTTTSRGFYYEVGFMLGLNENRITGYDEPVNTPSYQKWEGTPYKAARTGLEQIDGGYFTSVDDLHGYPNSLGSVDNAYLGIYKLLDYNADGKITNTDLHAIEGIAYPPVVGSINLGLGYKGFSFNMLFYGTAGKYIEFNRSYWKEFIKQDWTVHTAQLDYWTPTNRNASHAALSFDDKLYSMLGGSANSEGYDLKLLNHSWRKSDYLSLKEVYLSYKFDGKKLEDVLGVKGLSLTLTGNNLFMFSDLIEGNPQRTEMRAGYYPIMRSVKLGVKLDF